MGGERTQTAPSHAQFTHLEKKKKERIIKKGQYMQTLHILPALRKKLQDSDGTFNLRKERKEEKKKTHQFYCLLDYIEKYENLH